MGDQKITELDENTTPVGTDLLAIVDDPGSTPKTEKIEAQNVTTMLSPVKCRVYLSAAQNNLTDNTITKINFNAETYDIGADYDTGNYRFTAPVTGYYQVNVTLTLSSVVADKRYDLWIYVNEAIYAGGAGFQSSSTGNLILTISDVVYATSGQYIEAKARPNSIGGNTVDVASGGAVSYMSIHLLSL